MRSLLPPLLAVVSLFGAARQAAAAEETPPPAALKLTWQPPEKGYADVLLTSDIYDVALPEVQKLLEPVMAKQVRLSLPRGSTLEVSINELDLAGQRVPTSRGGLGDNRTYRASFPPRLEFSWRLLDAAGTELGTGTKELTDSGYLGRATFTSSSVLKFEETLWAEWVKATARALKRNGGTLKSPTPAKP